ncbi:unnamed protein product [Schistosoma mattheei]|uniref:Uncharacterized protein n=1 Tax=Schistosoma mattheei TaxID=31246 RepID=A0A183NF09_9TREM|nr:unnamed protein product [Schistosoma mattheei]
MGSPLGPILADIFMGNLELKKLKRAIDGTTMYCRHIDDTFLVCNNHEHAIELIDLFNKAHKDIEFTMEQEVEGKFHFLDIGIKRTSDGTIHRHIHHKNTWSGLHLNYYSFCPMSYKKGIVRTTFDCARKLCSKECLDDEINLIINVLREYVYPLKSIQKHAKTNLRTKYDGVEKKTHFLHLRFKGDEIAGLINHRLTSALKVDYPAAKLMIV